jgi:hypothetical protein
MVWAALVVACSAALNRVRGDKSLLNLGKSLWYVAPVFGVVGLFAGLSLPQGAALAGLYLGWALPPWGRWFGLGRAPLPQRSASWFETLVERITGPVHGRFLIRHAVLVPGLAVLAYWSIPWALAGLLLPFLFVSMYELCWKVYDYRFCIQRRIEEAPAEARGWRFLRLVALAPTVYAEALVGGLWGSYALLGAHLTGG